MAFKEVIQSDNKQGKKSAEVCNRLMDSKPKSGNEKFTVRLWSDLDFKIKL